MLLAMPYHLVAPTGTRVPLPVQPIRFGTDASADVRLSPELGLAPLHFLLQPNGIGFTLETLSEGHPVFVNDEAIESKDLQNGDLIQAGQFRVVYHVDGGTSPPSAPVAPPMLTPEPEPTPEPAPTPDAPKTQPQGKESSTPLDSAFFSSASLPLELPVKPVEPLVDDAPVNQFRLFTDRLRAPTEESKLPQRSRQPEFVTTGSLPEGTPAAPHPPPSNEPFVYAPPPTRREVSKYHRLSIVSAWLAAFGLTILGWSALLTLLPLWGDFAAVALLKVPCFVAGGLGVGLGIGTIISRTVTATASVRRALAISAFAAGAILSVTLLAIPLGAAHWPGLSDGVTCLVDRVTHLRELPALKISWFRVVNQVLQPWAILAALCGGWIARRVADE